MRKPLLVCAALVIGALFAFKPWMKEKKPPLQMPQASTQTETTVASSTTPIEEENEPVELIDLSQLPNQPPEPVMLPELPPDLLAALVVKPHAEEVPAGPTPSVPQFEVHAVVTATAEDQNFGPSYDPVMVRPSPYHRDHPECPYLGGYPEEDEHSVSAKKPKK